jgi:hypothetical protein
MSRDSSQGTRRRLADLLRCESKRVASVWRKWQCRAREFLAASEFKMNHPDPHVDPFKKMTDTIPIRLRVTYKNDASSLQATMNEARGVPSIRLSRTRPIGMTATMTTELNRRRARQKGHDE